MSSVGAQGHRKRRGSHSVVPLAADPGRQERASDLGSYPRDCHQVFTRQPFLLHPLLSSSELGAAVRSTETLRKPAFLFLVWPSTHAHG